MTFMHYEEIQKKESNMGLLNKKAHFITIDNNGLIQQFKHLNIHGINTMLITDKNGIERFRRLNFKNIYLIPVFQQKILTFFKQKQKNTTNWSNNDIFQQKGKKVIEEIPKLNTKREQRIISEIAIRAVYALNLDYALVKVGVTVGEKPWILYVNPTIEGNEKIEELFNVAIQEFLTKWNQLLSASSYKVTLGADPEFVLRGPSGQLILASQYLPKKGLVGCDDIWTNHDRSQLPLGEFRPIPSEDPKKLLINLYRTMLLGSKKIRNTHVEWLAGALPIKGYPIGGHVHFSHIWLNSFLLRALDNYLTLPIFLLEDPNGKGRRPKYGFLGDYREQFHGGFEYRTLPSWIVSPTITKGVFALAKIIAENYIYLYQNPLQEIEIQRAYYEGDKDAIRPVVEGLWEELKQLKDYQTYQSYLNPLKNLIDRDYSWDENKDIRKLWKLPPYHK
ncbi:hypothetical protein TEPIDINF_000862 [Tepidibacillus infernus]|uniref:PhiEco32-like amidoligase-type 2 protein n=1 Tax=Tepidibacillus decaturensis TaxID=1413211 RepID=A0A135L3A9_9BACI|nr:hypothetical protein [Tepidibacillus decaturensis]KXG43472.1 hypothetical protein U473_05180 [Tepidibacillus decaturensis]